MCVVQSREGRISFALCCCMCVWVVCICMCVVQSREGRIRFALCCCMCVWVVCFCMCVVCVYTIYYSVQVLNNVYCTCRIGRRSLVSGWGRRDLLCLQSHLTTELRYST